MVPDLGEKFLAGMHAFLLSVSGEKDGSVRWCGDESKFGGGVKEKGESFLFLRNEHCTHMVLLSRGSIVFLAWVGVVRGRNDWGGVASPNRGVGSVE